MSPAQFRPIPLWTALVTPFSHSQHQNHDSIQWDNLDELLKAQSEADNGVLLLGSTGENLGISFEEKKAIVERSIRVLRGKPLMVGVGGIHLPQTLEWLAFLESQEGISHYLMVTPIYAKPSHEGQYEWFKALLQKTSRPCILYNIPSRAGTPLSRVALKKLSQEFPGTLLGVKESSGSIQEFLHYRKDFPDLQLYAGDDALFPFFRRANACGLMSVVSNVFPREVQRIVQHFLAGADRPELVEAWCQLSDLLFLTTNPIPTKYLLHQKGWIESPYVRPPLSAHDMTSEAKKTIMQVYPLMESIVNLMEKDKN